MLVYVCDVILAGNSLQEMKQINEKLHKEFRIKDLGKLKYFLGIHAAHSKLSISLLQRKYYLDLLQDSKILCAKSASTPLDPSTKLHKDANIPYHDIPAYKRLVGRLLYPNAIRSDIRFCTQQLSQFIYALRVNHFNAVIQVLRYLKSCPDRGIFLPRDSQIKLQGYSNANWTGCSDTRRFLFET